MKFSNPSSEINSSTSILLKTHGSKPTHHPISQPWTRRLTQQDPQTHDLKPMILNTTSEPSLWTPTYNNPLAIGYEGGLVSLLSVQAEVEQAAIMCPRAELELTQLVVEWEPLDVDATRAEEDAWRYPQTRAVILDDYMCGIGAINVNVGARWQHHSTTSTRCWLISTLLNQNSNVDARWQHRFW